MAKHYLRGNMNVAIVLLSWKDIDPRDTRLPKPSDLLKAFQKGTPDDIVQYYSDMSHGNITMNDSSIFGWWPMKYSYQFDSQDPFHNPAIKRQRRLAFVDEARRLLQENNVDLTRYRGGLVVVTNGVSDGGNAGTSVICPLGGEWWGQPRWHHCYKCSMLYFGANITQGPCPSGGLHDKDREFFAMANNVTGYTGDTDYRRCVKCFGMYSIPSQNSDITFRKVCAGGGRHEPGTGVNTSYPYTLSYDKDAGFISRNWKRCDKCHVLAWTGSVWDETNIGTCLIDSGGTDGKKHDLNLARIYNVAQYFDGYHVSFLTHEFGHSLGLAESWRKRSDKEASKLPDEPKYKDDIYGDAWDIMSVLQVWYFDLNRGPHYAFCGPSINAPTLLKLGWLPAGSIESVSAHGSLTRTARRFLQPLNGAHNGTRVIRVLTPTRIYTVEFRKKQDWDRAIPNDNVVLIHELRSDHTLGEKGWRGCTKCSTIFCATSSACSGGESHYCGDAIPFIFMSSDKPGQTGWRICSKCRGVWFGDNSSTGGVCEGGGTHEQQGQGVYTLHFNDNSPGREANWRWCNKCQLMFKPFKDLVGGVCPAGGEHNATGSGDYMLMQLDFWNFNEVRRCLKCRTLVHEGYGSCVYGGRHSRDEGPEGAYAPVKNLEFHPGQSGWKKCVNCYQLVFSSNGNGVCKAADGRGHVFGSDNYKVMFNSEPDANLGRVGGWKWCRKCQVLALAPHGKDCAAGGKHDHTGSGEYVMTHFFGDYTYLLGRDQTGATDFGTEYEWTVGQRWKSPDNKVSMYVESLGTEVKGVMIRVRYSPSGSLSTALSDSQSLIQESEKDEEDLVP